MKKTISLLLGLSLLLTFCLPLVILATNVITIEGEHGHLINNPTINGFNGGVSNNKAVRIEGSSYVGFDFSVNSTSACTLDIQFITKGNSVANFSAINSQYNQSQNSSLNCQPNTSNYQLYSLRISNFLLYPGINNIFIQKTQGNGSELYIDKITATINSSDNTTNTPTQVPTNNASSLYTNLQTNLWYLNFYKGNIDGIKGNQLISAIAEFKDFYYGRYNVSQNVSDSDILESSKRIIIDIQNPLKLIGYYTGAADGIAGSGTREATRKVQTYLWWPQKLIRINSTNRTDGIADLSTRLSIQDINIEINKSGASDNTIKRNGSNNKYSVINLQEALIELYNNKIINTDIGKADGIFGANTEKAVQQFQSVAGLNPDGIVGPITWRLLYLFT